MITKKESRADDYNEGYSHGYMDGYTKAGLDYAEERKTMLDKIRAEIDDATEIHSDGEFYIKNIDVKRIIDKYQEEGEEK